jgi:hypothetical protein
VAHSLCHEVHLKWIHKYMYVCYPIENVHKTRARMSWTQMLSNFTLTLTHILVHLWHCVHTILSSWTKVDIQYMCSSQLIEWSFKSHPIIFCIKVGFHSKQHSVTSDQAVATMWPILSPSKMWTLSICWNNTPISRILCWIHYIRLIWILLIIWLDHSEKRKV